MRFVLCFALFAIGCDNTAAPVVVTDVSPRCGLSARLVLDVCTDLGSDDRCTATGDVCVALCDERETCTTVDDNLRELSPWPTAPDGYCVACVDP